MIKICPWCGQLVMFPSNPSFHLWVCLNPECDWYEEITEAKRSAIEGRRIASVTTILGILADVNHFAIREAARDLINHVRTKYGVPPGEPLSCEYMRRLEAALEGNKE